MTKYIRVPFADSGDKADVPVASASDGSVSFVQGYPIAYSLDPETDTAAKRIERTKMNFLFNQITAAIQEIQQNGVAPYIAAADNGGSAYAYGLGAMVMYNGVVYQSLVANNTQLPTVAANWSPVANAVNSLQVFSANVTGDLNTVIATGIYSVTPAATNAPAGVTAQLEVYRPSSSAVIQIWHSGSAVTSVQNRHYVRTATVSGGVASGWTAWSALTMRPIELVSGQDLNSLTESGTYTGGSFVNGPSSLGSAVASLIVISSGTANVISQILHRYSTNDYFIRTYAGGVWLAWKQVVTSDSNPGRLLNVQVLTNSGTYTPTSGTKTVKVRVVGAGGGGAGASAGGANTYSVGGGGGAGAYVEARITVNFSTLAFTVGAGGTAGDPGTNNGTGGTGGLSSFGTFISALGGTGGFMGKVTTSTTTDGNAGGGGFGADDPTVANLLTNILSQGGGSGFPGYMISGQGGNGGNGGSSPLGPGGFGSPNGAGSAGRGAGSGGGGALTTTYNTTGRLGGAGAKGMIIVEEYA